MGTVLESQFRHTPCGIDPRDSPPMYSSCCCLLVGAAAAYVAAAALYLAAAAVAAASNHALRLGAIVVAGVSPR